MIELTITAWHPCSVWKTGGGLQPTVESLNLPREFITKLETWRKQFDSTCGEPLFSRRKEHDAEGRAIAAELQQAAGDKIQVIFRHWVAYDQTQWRSFWREENLHSGKCKEFWLEEDLPDELSEKLLTIYPDFSGTYLWDLNGGSLGVEDIGGTEELDERFRTWSRRWENCVTTKTYKIDYATLAAERFDQQGLALAAELKKVVCDKSRIIYCFTLKKAAAEILADSSTQDWPFERDNRKFVLDGLVASKHI